jgi:hypothetical protein
MASCKAENGRRCESLGTPVDSSNLVNLIISDKKTEVVCAWWLSRPASVCIVYHSLDNEVIDRCTAFLERSSSMCTNNALSCSCPVRC